MKKIVYILLISLQLFALFTGCSKASRSGTAANFSYDETKLPSPREKVITEDVTIKTEGLYNKLYQIQLKNENIIAVLYRDNAICLTPETSESFSTESMIELTLDQDSSAKLLVNKDNPLPKDFSPKGLKPISASKVKLEYPNLKLIPCTLDALYSMVEFAEKDGIKGFIVNSAYRSISEQETIFNVNLESFKKVAKTYDEALSKTRQLVALPGYSEHHTGLSLDLFSINGRHRNDFEGTKEQIWLIKNLHRFGFILRYPKDKTLFTGCTYEPWHIRYVGISLSTYLNEYNLCLEEFYEKIFNGEILESNNSVFIGVKNHQKVFIDPYLLEYASLEMINADNLLLTVTKN